MATRTRIERIAILPGGWVVARDASVTMYARMREDPSGRLRAWELFLDSEDAITPEALRDLPLGEVEAVANMHRVHVLRSLGDPGGDRMRVLASHLGDANFNPGQRLDESGEPIPMTWAELALEDWIASSWLASLDAQERADLGLAKRPPTKAPLPRRIRGTEADYHLTSGPNGALDDDFLTRLARAYRAALARGERPNVAIRRDLDDGFSKRTVETWVYQARKRGYLPPARKGAAG